jgi:hypothetical protein
MNLTDPSGLRRFQPPGISSSSPAGSFLPPSPLMLALLTVLLCSLACSRRRFSLRAAIAMGF